MESLASTAACLLGGSRDRLDVVTHCLVGITLHPPNTQHKR